MDISKKFSDDENVHIIYCIHCIPGIDCMMEFLFRCKIEIYEVNDEIVHKNHLKLFDGFREIIRKTCHNRILQDIMNRLMNASDGKNWRCYIKLYKNGSLEILNHNIDADFCRFLIEFLKVQCTGIGMDDEENSLMMYIHDCSYTLPAASLTPFSNQIAGHGLHVQQELHFLKFKNLVVLKPVQHFPKGRNEILFYESVFGINCDDELHDLRRFIPRYYGLFSDKSDDSNEALYIGLEDVISMFTRASIADIKLGRVSYAPNAAPDKIAIEKSKYIYREKLGFLFTGIKVANLEAEDLLIDRYSCLSFNPSNVLDEGFHVFLTGTKKCQISLAKKFIAELQTLRDWFTKNKRVHFYSASLLLAYESYELNNNDANSANDIPPNVSNQNLEPCSSGDNEYRGRVLVRLIDFTHISWEDSIDENCIYGIDSLINFFGMI